MGSELLPGGESDRRPLHGASPGSATGSASSSLFRRNAKPTTPATTSKAPAIISPYPNSIGNMAVSLETMRGLFLRFQPSRPSGEIAENIILTVAQSSSRITRPSIGAKLAWSHPAPASAPPMALLAFRQTSPLRGCFLSGLPSRSMLLRPAGSSCIRHSLGL